MNIINISFEFITGVSLGFEYVNGPELFEEDETKYLIIDLFIFRLLITKDKI